MMTKLIETLGIQWPSADTNCSTVPVEIVQVRLRLNGLSFIFEGLQYEMKHADDNDSRTVYNHLVFET